MAEPSYLSTLFEQNDTINLFRDIQSNALKFDALDVPRGNIYKAVFMHKEKEHTVVIKTYSSKILGGYNFDHANIIIQTTPQSIWPTCAEFLPRFHNETKFRPAICCMGEYTDLHNAVANKLIQTKNIKPIVKNLFTLQQLLQQNELWFLDCKLHNFGYYDDIKVCLLDIDAVLDKTTFDLNIARFPYGVTIPVVIWPKTSVTYFGRTFDTYGQNSVFGLHLSTFVLFCMCACDIIKGVCRDSTQTASELYANVHGDSAESYFANITTNVLQQCEVFNEIDEQLYTTTESHLAMLYKGAYDANYPYDPPRKRGRFVDLAVLDPTPSNLVETKELSHEKNALDLVMWLREIGQSTGYINGTLGKIKNKKC